MYNKQTFEEFLQQWFISMREVNGTPIIKDNFEDLFDQWLNELDGEEYIKLGELYDGQQYLAGQEIELLAWKNSLVPEKEIV